MSELPGPEQLQEVLELGPRRRRRRRWFAAAAALAAGAGAVALALSAMREAPVTWRTETARVEDLHVRVTAVGTVEPREVIAVGSEQSGLVYDVFVDENDPVTAGQSLAALDTEVLTLQYREQHAQVAALAAQLSQARVAAGARALDLARAEALARDRVVAAAELEAARAAHDQAAAAVAAAAAQVSAARLRRDLSDTNLNKSIIRSPIDGVVLTRNVEPGQPVVAALQAVTLFEVAADLRQLLVEVDVDEADVARVRAGQPAGFTVAAWPEREFRAIVAKVHLAADTSAGVVTYRAELLAENPDGALLPGMTATARIDAETHAGAVTVPLAALRFAPAEVPEDLPPLRIGQGRVWHLVDGSPEPLLVELGPTDGVRQAVTGLEAGTAVILGRGGAAK